MKGKVGDELAPIVLYSVQNLIFQVLKKTHFVQDTVFSQERVYSLIGEMTHVSQKQRSKRAQKVRFPFQGGGGDLELFIERFQ